MIAIRVKSSDSWLDKDCSGIVGWKFARRLWERCKGRKGLFVTLTYKRDEYAGQADLYHRAARDQHVAKFIGRLQRRLGVSLKGKWCCKMEFQDGGWLHWHLVILDVARIESNVLAAAWARGFIKIRGMTKKRCFYLSKYVAKDGKVPFWLYNERPRSVKIVRVSPGFWGGSEPKPRDDMPRPQQIDAYVCIGERLTRKGLVISLGNGRRFSKPCSPGHALFLFNQRHRCRGVEDGWFVYDCTLDDLADCVRLARQWERSWLNAEAAKWTREAGAARAQATRGRAAALNLRGTGNPDDEALAAAPWWTVADIEDDARYASTMPSIGSEVGGWC